jgi:RND superfamily putative drug exporter
MLASMYLLLLVTFRSIFLPLQAIVINLLSVAATYGILVALFQWGWASSLLGLQSTGYVQNFVPVLLLALLFSLSTDYMVFLLNRVREYDRTGMSNHDSVVAGVAATGPLITGAATLMVAVFGAFAFASIMPITQLGVGMAVAIALDATVVRLVVVPAVMRLMGRLNWWLPGRRVPAGQYPGEDVESRVQVRI